MVVKDFNSRPIHMINSEYPRLRCGERKTNEGLAFGGTAVNANFMNVISHGKEDVLCEQYRGHITDDKMKTIMVRKSCNPMAKRIT